MRLAIRGFAALLLAALLPSIVLPVYAQADKKAAVEEKLKAQFTLTKMSSNANDIVTAGSVLVLHKDGLQMCSTQAVAPITNTYKNGKLSVGFGSQMLWGGALGAANQNIADIAQRKFVSGEKFWLVSYSVQDDLVVLKVYSDPYDDVRYYAQLKFSYPKGASSADDMIQLIDEVVTAEPADDASQPAEPEAAQPSQQAEPTDDASQAAPAPEPAPEQALAPIAPPPPPADAPPAQPKTVALGQTKEQVAATFGAPQKVATIGAKEIDYYPGMKVIFVKGKVTDVQ